MPVQPKHLDYENAQILLIGHKDHGLDKASVPQKEDQQENKDEPKEEMEKLEHEDEIRVEHLKGTCLIYSLSCIYANRCTNRRRHSLRGPQH